MQHFKPSITQIPVYHDGIFKLFEIKQDSDNHFPQEYIKKVNNNNFYYQELSMSDTLRFENDQREKKLTKKIRIPQTKEITSLNVLEIDNEYHKVYNTYHFTNKEGFKQTDLTLEEYFNQEIREK